jgi:hypothetical protein
LEQRCAAEISRCDACDGLLGRLKAVPTYGECAAERGGSGSQEIASG